MNATAYTSTFKTFLNRNPDEVHIMVDLETLDTIPSARVTEIGACVVAYSLVDAGYFWNEVVDPRGTQSLDTIQWRLDQGHHWYQISDVSVAMAHDHFAEVVLRRFFAWIKSVSTDHGKKPVMWCKGTDFDAAILKNMVERYMRGFELPWRYSDFHDVRTLLKVFPQFKIPKELVKHNGLDDAIQQASQLLKIADHVRLLEESTDTLRRYREQP